MILRNNQTGERTQYRLPRTLFMIFGGFYFLFMFRPRAFVKYLLLDALTLCLHRNINVFFLGRILERELKGPWVVEDSRSLFDWVYPAGQLLVLALAIISGFLR